MRSIIIMISGVLLPATAWAQTSDIREQHATTPTPRDREAPPVSGQPLLETWSLVAVRPPERKIFKVNDLITIIVRERVLYEADGTANARRQADLRSELDAFIKFTGGGIGAATFRRGKPNINYRSTFNQRNNAESEREDRLTTRVTARVIDIKPNGNLVFEARKAIQHDDELHAMTLTGFCRSSDLTPDNSVLSTQVADLQISIDTKGSIRNATRAGWIGTIYDWIRPL